MGATRRPRPPDRPGPLQRPPPLAGRNHAEAVDRPPARSRSGGGRRTGRGGGPARGLVPALTGGTGVAAGDRGAPRLGNRPRDATSTRGAGRPSTGRALSGDPSEP